MGLVRVRPTSWQFSALALVKYENLTRTPPTGAELQYYRRDQNPQFLPIAGREARAQSASAAWSCAAGGRFARRYHDRDLHRISSERSSAPACCPVRLHCRPRSRPPAYCPARLHCRPRSRPQPRWDAPSAPLSARTPSVSLPATR